MTDEAISKLVTYALRAGLIEESEKIWATNAVLEMLKLDSYADPGTEWGDIDLAATLDELTHDAYARGVIPGDSTDYRDLLDTALMGRLTPRPAQVIEKFRALYAESPQKATDWYYQFSQDTNYIRRDRIARDMKWTADTEYGRLDITVNLSKPEKDPKAIAAARNLPASAYPRCQLCAENEGYAGRLNHPARQNHRTVRRFRGSQQLGLSNTPSIPRAAADRKTAPRLAASVRLSRTATLLAPAQTSSTRFGSGRFMAQRKPRLIWYPVRSFRSSSDPVYTGISPHCSASCPPCPRRCR